MHAVNEHVHERHSYTAGAELQEALEVAWPELAADADLQATLVAILDDGSLAEVGRIGEDASAGSSADIWSDDAWRDLIDVVRNDTPSRHVEAPGRVLVPVTRGPVLYGALELRSQLPASDVDDDTVVRVSASLAPVLLDHLDP